jgi:hypothetical protein
MNEDQHYSQEQLRKYGELVVAFSRADLLAAAHQREGLISGANENLLRAITNFEKAFPDEATRTDLKLDRYCAAFDITYSLDDEGLEELRLEARRVIDVCDRHWDETPDEKKMEL